MSLTSEQQAAVDANDPALVIRAPAGTGKTEVLVQRGRAIPPRSYEWIQTCAGRDLHHTSR